MKKLFCTLFFFITVHAVSQEVFKAGIHAGFPVGWAGDYSGFNMGFDLNYMLDVGNHIEVGPMLGYTLFTGKNVYGYYYNYRSKGWGAINIAGIARYNINDFLFGSFGLGLGIPTDGADVGVLYQPRFGYKNEIIDAFTYFRGIGRGDSAIGFGVAYKF